MREAIRSGTGRAANLAGVLLLAAACGAAEAAGPAGRRIMPDDLVYRGAFRLPDGPDEYAWGWSGQGMAYNPQGDPKGADDGHPGSLFGIGHNWHQYVSEVAIPRPVIPSGRSTKGLPVARTLQKFQNVRGKLFGEMEQARAGLACLPALGQQTAPKLYFCWGPHMDEAHRTPSHGWCELDLANPRPAGPWRIDNEVTYVTTDYLLEIPADWAKAHVQGMRLATGRFRDGGQGSQGPTLLAFAPWQAGNPPARGTQLKAVTLLKYSSVTDETQRRLRDYHHADEWSGAAWLTAGRRGAVVFVGTKGRGKCWYGFANGVVWPEGGPFPPVPAAPNDQRGWWSTSFVGYMLFYDPADLAAVAAGKMKPSEPQPYATLDIDKVRLAGKSPGRRLSLMGAASFDRTRGLLYVFEPRADEDKSVVHVWQVRPRPAAGGRKARPKAARRAKAAGPPDPPTSHYEKRQLRGWTLRVHRDLLDAKNAKLLADVLAELDNHLYRIERAVPARAVAKLRKVVLWVEHDNPKARHAHYHPSAGWLKANGYNVDKVKGVEFGAARNFLRSTRHQPWMVLHELAHAYHDQVLGWEHPKIMAAYEAARKAGTYEKVLIWNGRVGRHYAMTNHKEYFAENTEAYFGTNDIYPFVKAELKRHDPNMYAVVAEVWGVAP